MKNATKRTILRWIHLIVTIPILGYIYGKPAEVEKYVGAARIIFIPLLMLTGYWMYAGAGFAIIAVAAWLAAIHFVGFNIALLSQVVLLIARRIWVTIRARQNRRSGGTVNEQAQP